MSLSHAPAEKCKKLLKCSVSGVSPATDRSARFPLDFSQQTPAVCIVWKVEDLLTSLLSMQEPRCPASQNGPGCPIPVTDFYSDLSQYLKSINPNQLVCLPPKAPFIVTSFTYDHIVRRAAVIANAHPGTLLITCCSRTFT